MAFDVATHRGHTCTWVPPKLELKVKVTANSNGKLDYPQSFFVMARHIIYLSALKTSTSCYKQSIDPDDLRCSSSSSSSSRSTLVTSDRRQHIKS